MSTAMCVLEKYYVTVTMNDSDSVRYIACVLSHA